jgi:membrane protein CcdC involved in cytochrome C biogenesis
MDVKEIFLRGRRHTKGEKKEKECFYPPLSFLRILIPFFRSLALSLAFAVFLFFLSFGIYFTNYPMRNSRIYVPPFLFFPFFYISLSTYSACK